VHKFVDKMLDRGEQHPASIVYGRFLACLRFLSRSTLGKELVENVAIFAKLLGTPDVTRLLNCAYI